MELRLIQRLVRIMQQGEVTELELDDSASGVRVRLKRGGEPPGPASPVVHVTHAAAPAVVAPGALAAAPAPGVAPAPAAPSDAKPFLSPMVGTFYRAASPEAEPFVSVGSPVRPETVLCIIEAMKVMNEIRAETSGRIVEVLVDNGAAVEFGQPLFLLKPA